MTGWSDCFAGITRLYGQQAGELLQQSHIAVIGLGGVGSWTVEALARTGVGALTLVDFDDICVSNTNRQLHAMEGLVGKQKTAALRDRVLRIHPNLQVRVLDAPYDRDLEEEFFSVPLDGVVDAIDHGPTKYDLVLACRERKVPLVISGSAGGRRDPSHIKTSDLSKSVEDPMLASLRKRLRQKAGLPRQGSMGIPCVFTTERAHYSDAKGCVTTDKPEDFNKPLDCATGFGTVTHVTGTFGFFLSHLVIQQILKKMSNS